MPVGGKVVKVGGGPSKGSPFIDSIFLEADYFFQPGYGYTLDGSGRIRQWENLGKLGGYVEQPDATLRPTPISSRPNMNDRAVVHFSNNGSTSNGHHFISTNTELPLIDPNDCTVIFGLDMPVSQNMGFFAFERNGVETERYSLFDGDPFQGEAKTSSSVATFTQKRIPKVGNTGSAVVTARHQDNVDGRIGLRVNKLEGTKNQSYSGSVDSYNRFFIGGFQVTYSVGLFARNNWYGGVFAVWNKILNDSEVDEIETTIADYYDMYPLNEL